MMRIIVRMMLMMCMDVHTHVKHELTTKNIMIIVMMILVS